MNRDVKEITDWLEQFRGQELVITKLEQQDEDLTQVQLKEVSLDTPAHAQDDDYIPQYELVLHGDGIVMNENQAPLPGKKYEIPLQGDWQSSIEESTLHLTTDRAEYTITRQ